MSRKATKTLYDNEKVYNELAEKRTIEILGLNDKEVTIAKAYETTKAVELTNIKNQVLNRHYKKIGPLTFRSLFSWKP